MITVNFILKTARLQCLLCLGLLSDPTPVQHLSVHLWCRRTPGSVHLTCRRTPGSVHLTCRHTPGLPRPAVSPSWCFDWRLWYHMFYSGCSFERWSAVSFHFRPRCLRIHTHLQLENMIIGSYWQCINTETISSAQKLVLKVPESTSIVGHITKMWTWSRNLFYFFQN